MRDKILLSKFEDDYLNPQYNMIKKNTKEPKKKRLFTIILFSTILFISACSKTSTSTTQAALTAQKLTSVLGSSSGTLTNGRVIYVNNNAVYVVYTATSYKITSDGYIELFASGQDTITFNLEYLKDYMLLSMSNNLKLDFSY